MDNICGDFVQKRSVVGNDQHRARVTLEVVRQESNRWNIQHVRRFYENVSDMDRLRALV